MAKKNSKPAPAKAEKKAAAKPAAKAKVETARVDDIAAVLAERLEVSKKDAKNIYNVFSDVILETIKSGKKFAINGIGTLRIEDVPERTGRNPQTGESAVFPAHKTVKFKASSAIKEKIK